MGELAAVLESLDDFSIENQEARVKEWIESKGYSLGEIMNAFRLALVGEVDFAGKIVEVSSASGFVEENTRVQVTRIAGGTIFVKGK